MCPGAASPRRCRNLRLSPWLSARALSTRATPKAYRADFMIFPPHAPTAAQDATIYRRVSGKITKSTAGAPVGRHTSRIVTPTASRPFTIIPTPGARCSVDERVCFQEKGSSGVPSPPSPWALSEEFRFSRARPQVHRGRAALIAKRANCGPCGRAVERQGEPIGLAPRAAPNLGAASAGASADPRFLRRITWTNPQEAKPERPRCATYRPHCRTCSIRS